MFAQASEGSEIDWRQLVTIVSIVLTLAMLAFTLWRGRKKTRIRPLFDVLRTIVQIGVLVAVPMITGVVTPVSVIFGAVLMGVAAGFMQGQQLDLALDGSKIYGTRSGVGLLVWGTSLVLMQLAALGGRTGLVALGQGIAAFSIGVSVGMMLGRQTKVDRIAKSAAALALVPVMLLMLVSSESPTPAVAMTCPAPPAGFQFTGLTFETCQYVGPDGVTAAVSTSSSGCGVAREDDWISRGGSPGSDVAIRDDSAQDVGDGFTWFQRYMVLGQNGVVAVASRNYVGGVAQQFIGTARQYSLTFQSPCDSPPPPPPVDDAPPPAVGDAPPPDVAQQAPVAPPPVVTRVVPENIDPDAVPESEQIADEGGSLFSDETTTSAGETTETASGVGSTDNAESQPPTVSSAVEEEETADSRSGSSTEVTPEEALATSIAGLVAAAMAGVITWAEAIAGANDLLGAAGREQNADALIGQVRDEFARGNAAAPPIDPGDPANDIFRLPGTGEMTISDGSQGVPPGYVWDPWGGQWLSPAQAAAMRSQLANPPLNEYGEPMITSTGRQRFPDGTNVPPGWVQITDENGTRWVPPDEAAEQVEQRSQDLDAQSRRDSDWDEQSQRDRDEAADRNEDIDVARRTSEEAAAEERLEAIERRREAYEQLERIRSAAARRGWDNILENIDNAFLEDGSIDPAYVDRLAQALSNRIGIEIMGENPTPSMLAETLRSLDETYGDIIPDALIDEVQRHLEETWIGDFTTGTLEGMRDSTALRILSGIASGGTSEVLYQSADLAEAILEDIDRAIAEGGDPADYMVLRNVARVLAENNAPINTARIALGDRPVTATEVLLAMAGDIGALLDIGQATGRTRVGSQALDQMASDLGAVGRRGAAALSDAVDAGIGRGARQQIQRTASEMAESLGESKGRADHAVDQVFRPVTAPINRATQAASDAMSSARRGVEDALGVKPKPGSRNVVPESARSTVDPENARGADEVTGGKGADEVTGGKDVDEVTGGKDVDEVAGGKDVDEVAGGKDVDEVTGGKDVDEVAGGKDVDEVATGKDVDEVVGGKDVDEVATGKDVDEVAGGKDVDDVVGGKDVDEVATGKDVDEVAGTKDVDEPGGAQKDVDGEPSVANDLDPEWKPLEPYDEWLRSQPPGTIISLDDIRKAGYTPKQAAALRRIAEKHGVIIGTRTTNLHSTKFIENGTAIPKPVWMKAKTINELDALIGGPPLSKQGQVGIFEPTPPKPPAPREAYQRFEQRKAEYNKLKPELDRLAAQKLIVMKEGVVYKVIDPGPPLVTKPFAGDIDGVAIIREDGTPVSGEEYERIVRDLKDSGAMFQHGVEANIVSDMIKIKTRGLQPGSYEFAQAERAARVSAEKLFDSLDGAHLDGSEQVIWTGRNGHSKGGRLDELAGWQDRIDGRTTDAPPPMFGRVNQDRDE